MSVYFDVCVPGEGKNAGVPTEFIRITTRGTDVVHRIATDEDRAKHPDQYQEFLKAKKDAPKGSLETEDADKVPWVHPAAPGKPKHEDQVARERGERPDLRPREPTKLGADAPARLQKLGFDNLAPVDPAAAKGVAATETPPADFMPGFADEPRRPGESEEDHQRRKAKHHTKK